MTIRAFLSSVALLGLLVGPQARAECTASHDIPPLARAAAISGPGTAARDSTDRWGYGYGALREDLAGWGRHPLAKVDSLGASVQGRGIWMLTITEGSDSVGRADDPGWRKRRVFVHARTHPSEVQAFHIAREMLEFLLDTTEAARELRRDYIWNIIPMYNPDGVELGHARTNANGVDIESNWNKPVIEPEVAVLKATFQRLMASPVPVEVALNLHSDQFNCTRFFFFHEEGGTSPAYVELEKDFIGKVRSHFEDGIEDWHFVKSWAFATGTQYPEGYWWTHFREKVMALTYEDANCPNAAEFEKTARALVLGAADYLEARPASLRRLARSETFLLRETGGLRVVDADGAEWTAWILSDPAGRRLASGGFREASAFLPTALLPRGASVLSLRGGRPGTARALVLTAP